MAQPSKSARPKASIRPASVRAKSTVRAASVADVAADRFDRSAYDLPILDLDEAIELATALLSNKPARTSAAVAEDSARLVAARDRAKTVRRQAGSSASIDARAYDVAMDKAWATFVRRIQDHVELGPERQAAGADIAKTYAIVRDLSILKLNYLAEFAQIGARIDALKREGLFEVARELAGAPFLEEVLSRHADYGGALGLMAAPKNRAADRGEARLGLIDAIAEYTVQTMAGARAGKPSSWAAVERALAPIHELRARKGEARPATIGSSAPPPHPPVGVRA